MLFTVQQLIDDRPAPTVIGPDQSGLEALDLMIQYDYSQLPVVDEASRLVGLITGDSLLRTVDNLGVLPKDLRVKDALRKPHIASVDSDIFDLIDDLKAAAAVLIVDAQQQLVGIVTDYDAMDFLRRRAEDMMLVEDIETSLKDHIRAAFSINGQVDEHMLATAIADVADLQKERAEQFQKALKHYLSLAGEGAARTADESLVQQVLAKHYPARAPDMSLDDLTIAEYVAVLLNKNRKLYLDQAFHVGAQAMRTLLDPVRETRNALFHFRGGITPQQRERLRYCAWWLAQGLATPRTTAETATFRSQGMDESASVIDAPVSLETIVRLPDDVPFDTAVAGPPAKEGGPAKIAATGELRVADYSRLTEHLRAQPPDRTVVSLAFSEIERLLGGSLPDAARLHRSWWSNDTATFAYAKAWAEAGWRVGADMIEELTTFTRERERERR